MGSKNKVDTKIQPKKRPNQVVQKEEEAECPLPNLGNRKKHAGYVWIEETIATDGGIETNTPEVDIRRSLTRRRSSHSNLSKIENIEENKKDFVESKPRKSLGDDV